MDITFDYTDVASITVRRAPGRKFNNKSSRGEKSNLFITWVTPETKTLLLEYWRARLGGSIREPKKSKYDPTLDRFLESEHRLVKITIEGKSSG
jgi:hypothetical protein